MELAVKWIIDKLEKYGFKGFHAMELAVKCLSCSGWRR